LVRSCSDIHNLLSEKGVAHEILHLPALSASARKAAEALGVPQPEIVKSLLFYIDGAPVMVLVPGDTTVDVVALAHELEAEEIALARGQQVLEVTGYRPGAVPPCALNIEVPVIADPGVFCCDVVYCGGGTTTTMLKIRSADLKALVRPRVAAIAKQT
jgi:prolyl-tRNA editing enzyme YbaK/EbsC (Cys-tRNA(Pro) deacylase)